MKPIHHFFCVTAILILAVNQNSAAANYDTTKTSVAKILKKVSENLNKFKILSYSYSYETKDFSSNDSFSTTASIILDFTRKDPLLGLSYQIDQGLRKFIYNGTEMFVLNKKLKTLNGLTIHPRENELSSLVFFQNSLLTLRNIIPGILSDNRLSKAISDTVIEKKNYWVVSFTPTKKIIDPIGKSFSSISIERDLTYKILIDRKKLLPYGIIQTFSDNNNFQKTFFTNIREGNKIPVLSWYYSTYSNEYSLVSQKEKPNLISPGTTAPDWVLPSISSDKSVSLSEFEGKYILLEFWVVNCGYCVAAVSKLNDLQNKFLNKNIEFVAINLYDSKEKIEQFSKKYNPIYKVLYDGESIAGKYGVISYPKVVLIDKEGKVIYSNSLATDELESILDKNLK